MVKSALVLAARLFRRGGRIDSQTQPRELSKPKVQRGSGSSFPQLQKAESSSKVANGSEGQGRNLPEWPKIWKRQEEGRSIHGLERADPVRQQLSVSFVLPLSLFKVFFLLLSYGNQDRNRLHPLDKAAHQRQLPGVETEIPLKKEGRKQTFIETLG